MSMQRLICPRFKMHSNKRQPPPDILKRIGCYFEPVPVSFIDHRRAQDLIMMFDPSHRTMWAIRGKSWKTTDQILKQPRMPHIHQTVASARLSHRLQMEFRSALEVAKLVRIASFSTSWRDHPHFAVGRTQAGSVAAFGS